MPAIGRSMLTTKVASRAILVNERASPFGVGWSLEGLERLYPQPDGTMLVTDGNGSATVFRRGPQVDLATVSSSIDDVLVLAGHGDGSFQPPQRFILGLTDPPSSSDRPSWMVSGDFNEDGLQDLAVTLSRTGEVALLIGQGRTTFATPTRIALGVPEVRMVAVADLNRDGHDDLAVISETADTVAIRLGRGDGTFQPTQNVATGDAPSAMAVGDLTGDAIPDLVVVNTGSQDATVLVGVGDGTFQPAPSLPVGRIPMAVVIKDFNADTVPDLVVANQLDETLSLFLGRGDGTFHAPRPVPVSGHAPRALAASDVNRDGRPDVAVADVDRNTVTVLLNSGAGAFQRLPDVQTGLGPIALATGDLNQDGLEDLAVTNFSAGSVSVFPGNGDGTFQRPRELPVGFNTVGIVVGEFDDRRGDPDQVFSGLPGDFSRVRKHADGTYARHLTDGTQLVFDVRGFHTRTIDRNGNETRYTYDALDRLMRVELPGSAAFDLRYDLANGRLASVSDSSGRTTQMLVDSLGDLRRITNPDGTARAFVYDAEHRLVSQTNTRGFTTDYAYDAFGRVTEAVLPARPVFDAVTGTVSSQREVRRFTPAETQGLINTLPVGVGTQDHPAAPVRPPLSVFQDGLGHTTQIATDAFGAPTQLIDPLGRTTMIDRDVNGQPARIIQPDGAQTTLLYDSRGNLTLHVHRLIDPRSTASFTPLITRFAYDPRFSQVTTITDARRDSPLDPNAACLNGCATTIEYDDRGNPLRMIDQLGDVTSVTYDARGLVLTMTDPLGTQTPAVPDDHQVRFSYDALTGNLLTTTDPKGNTTQLSYDVLGHVVSSTDAKSHTTAFAYDAMNRLKQVTDALSHLTHYAYDALGNLTAVTDAKSQTTTFTYDSLNQLLTTTNPRSDTKQFAYDLSRNLVQLTDPKQQTITFAYDAANQLLTKTLTDPSGALADTVRHAYDALGDLTLVQDADSKLTFAYDSAGRLIQAATGEAATPAAFAQPVTSLQYSYDRNGNRLSATGATAIGMTYAYDGLNRPIAAGNGQLGGANFTYDALSRLTKLTNSAITTFTYDDANELTSLTTTLLGNPLNAFAYAYDPLGNRTALIDRLGTHTYAYDALSRLTSATHPAASPLVPETFTYDAVGNRRTSHLSATHLHDAANRLLEDDTFRYTYDANGNRTSRTDKTTSALTTYTYDVENQLIRIDFPNGTVAAYRYDGLGRRIEKTVNGSSSRFVYDQEDLVSVYDAAGCWQESVAHGPGIDQPLAFVHDDSGDCTPADAVGFREQVRTLQTDGLGSVTSLVSETSGFFRALNLKERYRYDAFGQLTILGPGPDNLMDTADDVLLPQSAFGNLYFFTGREYDPESGLYYYRARYYDPHTGTFLQEDPLRFHGGPNFYTYAENNPVRWIDPLGLLPRKGDLKYPLTGKIVGDFAKI